MVNRNIYIAALVVAGFLYFQKFPFSGRENTLQEPTVMPASPPGAGMVEQGPSAGTFNVQAQLINETYNPNNLTQSRARKWSRTALINAGLYNPQSNAPTAAFYALPRN